MPAIDKIRDKVVKSEKVSLNSKISPDLRKICHAYKAETGTELSDIVTDALTEYFEGYEPKAETMEALESGAEDDDDDLVQ